MRAYSGSVENENGFSKQAYLIGQYGISGFSNYNSRDLMTSYYKTENGETSRYSFQYDVENNRISKTDPEKGGTIRFTYDGFSLLTAGNTFYLNGLAPGYVEAEIEFNQIKSYILDVRGTVRGVLTSGELKTFQYSAYGEAMGGESRKGPAFCGMYWDSESLTYHTFYRHYDPRDAHWMSMDPVKNPRLAYSPIGLNRYMYCRNNPLRYTDPYGDWFGADDIGYLIVGAVVGGVNASINNIGDLISGRMNGWDFTANIGLGMVSGAGSMWLNCNGIPVYFNLSTKGYSVGAGVSFGGLVNVGGGVHGSWDGSSVGLGVNAGLGTPQGMNLGLNAGVDFSRNASPVYSVGLGGGYAGVNAGANLKFNNEGYAGTGLSLGYSGKVGNSGFTYGMGGNVEVDKNGGMSYGANINSGYTGQRSKANEFGDNPTMQYNESMGISVGPDGIKGTGNYTSSRIIDPARKLNTIEKDYLRKVYNKKLDKLNLDEINVHSKKGRAYSLPTGDIGIPSETTIDPLIKSSFNPGEVNEISILPHEMYHQIQYAEDPFAFFKLIGDQISYTVYDISASITGTPNEEINPYNYARSFSKKGLSYTGYDLPAIYNLSTGVSKIDFSSLNYESQAQIWQDFSKDYINTYNINSGSSAYSSITKSYANYLYINKFDSKEIQIAK